MKAIVRELHFKIPELRFAVSGMTFLINLTALNGDVLKPIYISDYDVSALANAETSFDFNIRKPFSVRYIITR